MEAHERLRELICEIERCLECYKRFEEYPEEDRIKIRHWYLEDPWFFPPYENGVKGFFGTGKVVFVCQRPSTGKFASKADEEFYKLLKKRGLEDAHLTDLIKCRSKVGRGAGKNFEDDAGRCFKYLLRELEILDPKVIAAVGEDTYKYLKDHLPPHFKDRLFERSIVHYSSPFRCKKELRSKLKKRLRDGIIQVKQHIEMKG